MIQRILVINLMYIGDLLFMTPLLRSLRTSYPSAHIALLADVKNADVVRYNPHISELIAIDKKGYHNKLSNYINLIGEIRRHNFDLVINLHRNERATVIAAFSGARQIAGFATKGLGMFFKPLVAERTDCHQVQAYLEILNLLNLPLEDQGLEMWIDQFSVERADRLWQEAYQDNTPRLKVIGLNTGGSWPTKRWTKEGFAKLADACLEKGFGVAFFGGPMDQEDVRDIRNQMRYSQHPQIAEFTGRTSLLEMGALVKKCAVLVSGDSGPMHIAVSQKVPVISIFGPSNSLRYAPYGQEHIIIQTEQRCLACGLHECEEHSCMKDIDSKRVFSIVEKIVG